MLSFNLVSLETKVWGNMMMITYYFRDELQSLKKGSSDNAKDASNAPQNINDFEKQNIVARISK